MSNMIFPTLPGLMWDIQKHPLYSTEVMRSVSGKEVRAAFYSNPIWEWSLKFEFLRGYNAFTEFAQLQSFFSRLQGPYDSFLWTEPTDNAVAAHGFGAGDGATTAFQLQRMASPAPQQLNYWDPALYTPYTVPRTNLAQYSVDLTQAFWTKSALSAVGNVAIAPDGTPTADKLVEDATTSLRTLYHTFASVQPSTVYTTSVYAKAGERTWLRMTEGNTLTATAFFNLSNGTVGNITGTGSPTASILSIGNGWYRCILSWTSLATQTAANVQAGPVLNNGGGSYAGDGVSGLYLWGIQFESGSAPTPYISTTAASVTVTPNYWPKGGDGFDPIYNLNPATPLQVYRNDWQGNQIMSQFPRTNLVKQSQAIDQSPWTTSFGGTGSAPAITANYTTAPDSTNTADRLQLNKGAGGTSADRSALLQAGIATTAGNSYAMSVWLKTNDSSTITIKFEWGSTSAGQILTVTPVWQRFTMVKVAGNTNDSMYLYLRGDFATSNSADLAVWGFQAEPVYPSGSAGSYIPTTTTAVTLTDITVSSSGLITFTNAPLSGAVLTWTGAYYWRVRFKDDKLDFNQFASNFWELKKMDFVSVK